MWWLARDGLFQAERELGRDPCKTRGGTGCRNDRRPFGGYCCARASAAAQRNDARPALGPRIKTALGGRGRPLLRTFPLCIIGNRCALSATFLVCTFSRSDGTAQRLRPSLQDH